jgi:hypothetical protein
MSKSSTLVRLSDRTQRLLLIHFIAMYLNVNEVEK